MNELGDCEGVLPIIGDRKMKLIEWVFSSGEKTPGQYGEGFENILITLAVWSKSREPA